MLGSLLVLSAPLTRALGGDTSAWLTFGALGPAHTGPGTPLAGCRMRLISRPRSHGPWVRAVEGRCHLCLSGPHKREVMNWKICGRLRTLLDPAHTETGGALVRKGRTRRPQLRAHGHWLGSARVSPTVNTIGPAHTGLETSEHSSPYSTFSDHRRRDTNYWRWRSGLAYDSTPHIE